MGFCFCFHCNAPPCQGAPDDEPVILTVVTNEPSVTIVIDEPPSSAPSRDYRPHLPSDGDGYFNGGSDGLPFWVRRRR